MNSCSYRKVVTFFRKHSFNVHFYVLNVHFFFSNIHFFSIPKSTYMKIAIMEFIFFI